MDVRAYVYQVVDIFPSPLKTPARWVADRVFGVWDNVSAVFRVSIPHWHRIADNLAWFMGKATDAVERAAKGLRWLATVRIPQAIDAAARGITGWVQGLIDDVQRGLATTRDWLLDKARGFANAVYEYAHAVYTWVTDRLGEIWTTLTVVAKLVDAFLTDPSKLATWAIGAIWSAFWRYADQHLDGIIEFVWQRRSIVVSRLLDRTEAIIERLL